MAARGSSKKISESKITRTCVWLADGLARLVLAMLRLGTGKAGRIVAVILVLAGTGVGFARYARELDAFQVASSDIKILNRPSWMTSEIESEIMQPPGMPDQFSIFEKDLAPTLAKLYERYPWVAKVTEVRKEYPNQVYIQFELRRPVARVQAGKFFYYVDQHGARLSEKYYNLDEGLKMPLIVGVPKSIPIPGEEWTGGAVQAGIEVLGHLQKYNLDSSLGLDTIDVSNYGGVRDNRRSEIVFYQGYNSRQEVRVEWGRVTDSADYGELAVTDKILNLKEITARFPGLQGIKVLKLQFDDPYWVVR